MQVAWREASRLRYESENALELPGLYEIKGGYVERADPEYDVLGGAGVNWQASVYERASQEAARLGANVVIDVGCGDGRNHALLGDLEIVGIDYGENLERARQRTASGTFYEADLDEEGPLLGVSSGSVIVCADVIEHLRRPERLLAKLLDALSDASIALVSTPDRDLYHGRDHMGPPTNVGHAREWNRAEFAALLAAHGFSGRTEMVRSNDIGLERKTILATVRRR